MCVSRKGKTWINRDELLKSLSWLLESLDNTMVFILHFDLRRSLIMILSVIALLMMDGCMIIYM